MAHPLEFTEEARQELRREGERSLFFFARNILGFNKLNEWSLELCCALEGRHPYEPWIRFLCSQYRSSYKSTVCTQAYPLWRGIHIEDFATKIIEGSDKNAKKHHFLPMVDLFVSSPRSEFLQWLYSDRIPENFKGWNSESIVFNKTNPLANDAISYWGVNSKFEGWHGDLVVIDDAQGTEVEGSEIGATDAWRAYDRAIPLLSDQVNGQIIVVGVGPENRGRSFVHEVKDGYEPVIAAAA